METLRAPAFSAPLRCAVVPEAGKAGMKTLDLRSLGVITEQDLVLATRQGFSSARVSARALWTPSARDYAQSTGMTILREAHEFPANACPATEPAAESGEALFRSPEAMAIKAEIVRVGRKLWERQYVDGTGGNISARLGGHVICTPTQHSKGDLASEDLVLVDMEGKRAAGVKTPSSEILLHLEIYKAIPEAGAVVHCHPPHATAYALTGTVPPGCLIPEHEVFVGSVALAPYETPGTPEFARTVLPYVRDHNVVLLQNHGVVCRADTVTHAEWCVEVLDTTCRTIILASHLNAPLVPIPNRKTADLLEIKKKLGMPDPRYGFKECSLCDLPEFPDGITVRPRDRLAPAEEPAAVKREELEEIVQAITDGVMAALKSKG